MENAHGGLTNINPRNDSFFIEDAAITTDVRISWQMRCHFWKTPSPKPD